jgi:hypothetical protein
MAWTGTAVVTSLHRCIVRITGVSLVKAAAGTIGLAGGPGQIALPGNFPTDIRSGVLLTDLIQVQLSFESGPQLYSVTKVASPFLITVTNDVKSNTGPLEIWVRYFWGIAC